MAGFEDSANSRNISSFGWYAVRIHGRTRCAGIAISHCNRMFVTVFEQRNGVLAGHLPQIATLSDRQLRRLREFPFEFGA